MGIGRRSYAPASQSRGIGAVLREVLLLDLRDLAAVDRDPPIRGVLRQEVGLLGRSEPGEEAVLWRRLELAAALRDVADREVLRERSEPQLGVVVHDVDVVRHGRLVAPRGGDL